MKNRLREDLIKAGTMGRPSAKRMETYGDLTPSEGVTRPTGSRADKEARDFVVKLMEDAGLDVKVDAVGNIFGTRAGKKQTGTIMTGSHIDSVINGGMFDGALGVFAAIEAVRRIDEEGFENERPIEVVVFSSEEGTSFGFATLGSSVLTGKVSAEDALKMKNDSGRTLGEALEEIGYRGRYARSLDTVEYHVELHIEQGPVLHSKRIPIGIVERIAGVQRIGAVIEGRQDHSGTTPMDMRKDALVAASEIVLSVNRNTLDVARRSSSSLVGAVTKLDVFPNGINTVPGRVEMSVDIRDGIEESMRKLRDETLAALTRVRKTYGVRTEYRMIDVKPPVALSDGVEQVIERSCKNAGLRYIRMNSGAAHDAQNMASRVKTGMVFIPSVDGRSHTPLEWSEWENIETGTGVLTETIKALAAE